MLSGLVGSTAGIAGVDFRMRRCYHGMTNEGVGRYTSCGSGLTCASRPLNVVTIFRRYDPLGNTRKLVLWIKGPL
jgi:hypothetical protein